MSDALQAALLERARREKAAREQSGQNSVGAERGFHLGGLRENLIGEGAVDTPGEIVGDVLGTGAAGVLRGTKAMAELPEMAGRGAVWLTQTIMGVPKGDRVSVIDTATGRVVDEVYGGLAEAQGVARDYVQTRKGETTAGRYAGTVGEFLPGNIGGGLRGAVPMVTAGLASEAAGQATEGTRLEPYARVAGGIAGGVAGGVASAKRPSQVATAPDDIAGQVATLERHGIKPYRGQVTDSDKLMRMEGTLTPRSSQLDDVTSAALKTAGIDARRATPKVLADGQTRITNTMNSIVANVDVPITPSLGSRLLKISDDYFDSSAGRDLPVDLRLVRNEILDAATDPSGRTLSASLMKDWRTRLGSYTTSSNELTQDAAHQLRSVIDDATHDTLISLGRRADVAALAQSRREYRNFLAMVKAVNYSGREAARGIITPERLATATRRVFGDQSYALGRGGELPELARAGVAVLGAKPTVASGATREIMTPLTMGAIGAGGGFATGGFPPAVLGAGIGLGAPAAGQALMRSGATQSLLTNPAATAASSARLLPGLLSQRQGYTQ